MASATAYAQRYTAAGVAAGSEFRVNTETFSTQEWPAVAMSSGGNFIVTWMSLYQDNGKENYGIYAQRYTADGFRSGVEFRVNTRTEDHQQWPSVASDTNGNFVVTWMSYGQDGGGWGIYAQRYTAAGAPNGVEFRVNTTTANNQTDPNGVEFRVNTTTANNQTDPNVAMDPIGNFVVTWHSWDGDAEGIWAQRYTAAGTAAGGEFRVNTTTAYAQRFPSVAMDARGNFIVTWQSTTRQAADSWNIYAQRYTAAGAAAGGEFRVNTTTAEFTLQQYPSIAVQDADRFVVVWQGRQNGNDDVYAQRFGTANRPPVAIEQSVTTSENTTTTFTLAGTDPDSDPLTYAVVAWQQSGNGSLSCSSSGACQRTERSAVRRRT